jgi:hypothetical protein
MSYTGKPTRPGQLATWDGSKFVLGSGGFADNAAAERTRQRNWLRRNEDGQLVALPFNDLPSLADHSPGVAGSCLAVLGDKLFVSDGKGRLYAYDLMTQLSGAGPFSFLYDYSAGSPSFSAPTEMIGVRGTVPGFYGVQLYDYLFAIFGNDSGIALGQISGNPPVTPLNYSQIWQATVPSAPVRSCFLGGGGGVDATFGQNPAFAFSAANGHIYIASSFGPTITDAYNTGGDTPSAMFVDDDGLLWVFLSTSKTILILSIDWSTFILTLVQTIPVGVVLQDLISDGRWARGVELAPSSPVIHSWDLQNGTAGPVLPLAVPPPGASSNFRTPSNLLYDSVNDVVWVSDMQANSDSGAAALVEFDRSTQAADQAVFVPSLPLSGRLPNAWNGARRIVDDASYIYACSPNSGSALTAIVSKSTGLVVGLLQSSTGQARDICLDGLGNIYVVGRNNGAHDSSVIDKFSLATALTAYPGTTSPTATTSTTRAFHCCCWDPVTSKVFGGTYLAGTTDVLASIDPTTMNEVANQPFAITATFGGFMGLLAATNSIWCSTYTSTLTRVDPTAFPSAGINITTSVSRSQFPAYDAAGGTILVGDNSGGAVISRVSTTTNLEVSSFFNANTSYAEAVRTPDAIWVASDNSVVDRFSTTIGSEALLSTITSYTIPIAGATARLSFDGESLYVNLITPPSGGGGGG